MREWPALRVIDRCTPHPAFQTFFLHIRLPLPSIFASRPFCRPFFLLFFFLLPSSLARNAAVEGQTRGSRVSVISAPPDADTLLRKDKFITCVSCHRGLEDWDSWVINRHEGKL